MESWWANHLRRMVRMIDEYRLDVTCVVYEELVQRPKETTAALSVFVERPLDARYVASGMLQSVRHGDTAIGSGHDSFHRSGQLD